MSVFLPGLVMRRVYAYAARTQSDRRWREQGVNEKANSLLVCVCFPTDVRKYGETVLSPDTTPVTVVRSETNAIAPNLSQSLKNVIHSQINARVWFFHHARPEVPHINRVSANTQRRSKYFAVTTSSWRSRFAQTFERQ